VGDVSGKERVVRKKENTLTLALSQRERG